MIVLSRLAVIAALVLLTIFFGKHAIAQPPAQADQPQDLQINLADKANLNLSALVQWLAEEKGMKITASSAKFPANVNNKVIFYGDVRVSPDSMVEVVQSILRTNGFALVKSEVKDFYQIVELPEVRPYTPLVPLGEEGEYPQGEYLTGVFPLTHINQQDAVNYVKQMLYGNANEKAAANITALSNRNVLVITETSLRLAKIYALLNQIDIPGQPTIREFYPVKNLLAESLQQQLQEILDQPALQDGVTDSSQAGQALGQPKQLKIDAVSRTNQLLLSGTQAQIDEALTIIAELDVKNQLDLRTYKFRYISASKIDELIRQSLGNLDEEALERLYKSSVSKQTNKLIATTREEVHKKIEALKKQLDVESASNDRDSPIRFYTLKNVKAVDILDTLQSVERRFRNRRQRSSVSNRLDGIVYRNDFAPGNRIRPANAGFSPFTNSGTQFSNPFGDLQRQEANLVRRDELVGADLALESGALENAVLDSAVSGDLTSLASEYNQVRQVIPGEAKITVDENTNTLIVVAGPATQKLYQELISKLDVRRPQVLVEVTVVTIDSQDDFNFGMEISVGDREGDKRLFALTSFGLSDVDPITGALTIIPGLGFNGTLVDPETADVVVRALSRHRRAKVIAAPRILVNDNSTGLLSSVEERPFTGINAGNTVSTTSVAGFTQAGTTISVTPQISENDYLNLEFDVAVNNFVGAGSAGVPPPRVTDQVVSEVSIPDGHTVIVGGLTRRRDARDLEGLPIIERIPIINRLTSNEAKERTEQRLFVFIKPIILRDDKYKDLRYLSDLELRDACIPGDYPTSAPVLIR